MNSLWNRVDAGVFNLDIGLTPPSQYERIGLPLWYELEHKRTKTKTYTERLFNAGRVIERKNIIEFLDKSDNAKDLRRRIQVLRATQSKPI